MCRKNAVIIVLSLRAVCLYVILINKHEKFHEGQTRLGIFGFLFGIMIAAMSQVFSNSTSGRQEREAKSPNSAGQTSAPDRQAASLQLFKIDYSKRYDVVCTSDSTTPLIYRNCLILGFTKTEGHSKKEADAPGEGQFDEWLVVKLPDARHAYLNTYEVRAIEETKKPQ